MNKFILGSISVLGLLAAGCAPDGPDGPGSASRSNGDGEIVINMDEFDFGTDSVEVRVGETVTFVLVNAGKVEHEFMIGQNLVETAAGAPNGFEHDFFETITPSIDPPEAGMTMGAMDGMDMTDDAMADETADDMYMSTEDHDVMSDDAMTDDAMPADDDVHAGYMVQRRPTETARLTITITPDLVGTWEIGCFRDGGSHWAAGMRARLVVNQA